MTTKLKVYDSTSASFIDLPVENVLSAVYEDRGTSALDKVTFEVTDDLSTGTYNPFYNREVQYEVDSAVIFGGRIGALSKQKPLIAVEAWSYGAEFLNKYVNEVYESVTPEFIIEDIITKYTSLTYASSVTTGITIERIVFRDKRVAEVIELLCQALNYYFTTDEAKNAYLRPVGSISTGVTITVGTDTLFPPKWDMISKDIVTVVVVEGDKQNFLRKESTTATASQTVIDLTYEPVGSVQVTVNSAVKSPQLAGATTGDYLLEPEQNRITMLTPMTAGHAIVVDYTYSVPVKITQVADIFDASGAQILIERKISNKSIKTFADARRYGREYLKRYSVPQKSTSLVLPYFNPSLKSNEMVRVVHADEGISENFLISAVKHDYANSMTTVVVGPEPDLLFDWQKEVMARLRELSQADANADLLQEYRLFNHKVKTSLTQTVSVYERSPVNSFTLGHATLGMMRTGFNSEPDCSGNGRHGVWSGTGVTTGAQFSSTTTYSGGFVYPLQRLSCGSFNGTNRYVTYTGSVANVRAVSLFIKSSTNNRDILRLTTLNYITINSSGVVTIFGGGAGGIATAMSDGRIHIYAQWTAFTMNALQLGFRSTYFNGLIDELTIFNTTLTTAEQADMRNNNFYTNHAKFGNCVVWWAFDNPTLGDKSTAKQLVETL